jgi:hypothetical protein
MVHNKSDFSRWVLPSIEVDCMPSILPPLFNWLVFIREVETLREEVLDVFPRALGLVGLGRHFHDSDGDRMGITPVT